MKHLPFLTRLLTIGAWGYALVSLYRLAESFGLYASLLVQGVLVGLLLYFSTIALAFADKSPKIALFAATGCLLVALVL